jgi:hypothetical protein
MTKQLCPHRIHNTATIYFGYLIEQTSAGNAPEGTRAIHVSLVSVDWVLEKSVFLVLHALACMEPLTGFIGDAVVTKFCLRTSRDKCEHGWTVGSWYRGS